MKGLLLADIFSGTTMKTVRGDETTDSKKTVFSAQCWPQGETFKACKAQMDSPALHKLSNSKRLQQRTRALSYFSKGDSIFPWKDPALLDL